MSEDKRHPTYKGFWVKSVPYVDDDFAIDCKYDEPHQKRKAEILSKYPQIQKLYGPSYKTKYIIFLVAFLHILGLITSTKIKNNFILFFSAIYTEQLSLQSAEF